MASHIKRFSEEVLNANEGVESIAGKLRSYIRQDFHDADTGFHICGYQKEGKVSVPHVWYVHIKNGKVERRNIKQSNKETAYGATWSGQGDVVMSLISPVKVQVGKEEKTVRAPAPVLWDAMAIQDAVDFAIYAIRTTIDTMRFQARAKNVGGPIDVLVIKPDGAHWIQRKELIP